MWGIHLVLFCFSPHSGFGLILSFVSFSPLDLNTLCDTSWSSQIVSQLRPEKEVHENEDEKLFRFSFISAHVQHETWELFSASHIRETLKASSNCGSSHFAESSWTLIQRTKFRVWWWRIVFLLHLTTFVNARGGTAADSNLITFYRRLLSFAQKTSRCRLTIW